MDIITQKWEKRYKKEVNRKLNMDKKMAPEGITGAKRRNESKI